MATEREIKIIIRSDGTAAITDLRGVGTELDRVDKRTASFSEAFRKNWLAVAGGITATYLALQKIWSTMEQAAQLQERMENLDRLTSQYRMTAEDLTGAISRNSRGLIGMGAASEVATDALSKGFTPEQVLRMAQYSETLAEISGRAMKTSEAFREMEVSLVAARERGVVKMFGATIDLEAAYGKQAATMSKAEKAQALFTLAMDAAEKRQKAMGEQTDSAADRMERFSNSLDQAKFFAGQLLLVVGQPLMAVFNSALTITYGLAGGIGAVVASIARMTDELGITENRAEAAQKWSDAMFARAAVQAEQAKQNLVGAYEQLKTLGSLSAGAKGGAGIAPLGGEPGENQKRLEQLVDLMRKYQEQIDALGAAELDREQLRADAWLVEQKKKLTELHASRQQFAKAEEVFDAMSAKAKEDRQTKITDFYLAEQKRLTEESVQMEKDRNEALLREQVLAVETRLSVEVAAMAATERSESERIRHRAAGEWEILELRQNSLVASITEQTTFAETLKIMGQHRELQNQIEASKRVEAGELDVRRLVLQREITDLTRQQRDLLFEQQAIRAQEALGKIGGSEFGQNLGVVSAIAAGKDPYTQDFERWSDLQDQKIMRMEEIGAAEQQIKDAYREYDLQQEAMAQQQKLAVASSTFGMLAGLATSLYNMQGQQGGAAFEMMKAYRIGETAMNTYSAAVGAYNALASIPYVGPALGAAAAAAAIAFGMAQVQAIASMKPGSMGSGGGVGSISRIGMGASTEPAKAEPEKAAPAGPVVNVYFYSSYIGADRDALARDLVPSITKAVQDGVK